MKILGSHWVVFTFALPEEGTSGRGQVFASSFSRSTASWQVILAAARDGSGAWPAYRAASTGLLAFSSSS